MKEMFLKFLINLWEMTSEIAIYFLLAVLVTSFLKVYLSPSYFKKVLGFQKLSPLLTGLLAGLLPVCSCSVIPLAYFINSLSRSYASVLSFLIIGPVISPVSIFLTFGLLGPKFALFRLFITFAFSIVIAYLSLLLFKKSTPQFTVEVPQGREKSLKLVISETKKETIDIGKYLIIGLVVASLLVTFLTPDSFKSIAGHPWSYLLVALISVPIYVCSGEEVPIARALIDIGLTPGQAMIFMLAGSGVCLPTISAVLRFLPLKVVLYYVVSWFVLALISGFLFDGL